VDGVRRAGAWTGIYVLGLPLATEFESPALRSFENRWAHGLGRSMADDFKSRLAAALGVQPPPEPCAIQVAYDAYERKMCPLQVATPLPEVVSFLPENFPHLVKLQTKLANSSEWINAKWSLVSASLAAGTFNDEDYRVDPRRVHALQGVIQLLRRPHRIHRNKRHGSRAPGNIRGEHIYIREMTRNEVWVGFTLYDPKLKLTVVTSSFYASEKWLADCATLPAIYTRKPGTP